MKNAISYIAMLLLIYLFGGCASYTVRFCTIPSEEVEIFVNEEYKASTSKDGEAFEDRAVQVRSG